MSLSDDISKMDALAEGTCFKLFRQHEDLKFVPLSFMQPFLPFSFLIGILRIARNSSKTSGPSASRLFRKQLHTLHFILQNAID